MAKEEQKESPKNKPR